MTSQAERRDDQADAKARARTKTAQDDRHVEQNRGHEELRRQQIDDERPKQREDAHDRHEAVRHGRASSMLIADPPPKECRVWIVGVRPNAQALLAELGLSAAADDLLGRRAGRRKNAPLADRRRISAARRPARRDRLDRNEGSPRTRRARARFAAHSAQSVSDRRRQRGEDFDVDAAIASDYETIVWTNSRTPTRPAPRTRNAGKTRSRCARPGNRCSARSTSSTSKRSR